MVLAELSVPLVGKVVFCTVKVEFALKSIVKINEKEEGIVKFIGLVPSPRTTFELVPATIQSLQIVTELLF